MSSGLRGKITSFAVGVVNRCSSFPISKTLFLDAFSHLYKRVCPSVGRSVGWSVGRTRVEILKKCRFRPELLAVQARTHLMPCIRPCFLLSSFHLCDISQFIYCWNSLLNMNRAEFFFESRKYVRDPLKSDSICLLEARG